ncbi:uncharacterized protein LOC117315040 [Pecten maximus]|uniref:uncharacterized protein LOC117315040 n=1 Tax=Pecten maximus TaxID=6579 RepID=UPI001457FE54|nr:uncharacterized protein LOC117315040 [Pecten maximus]
MNGQSNPTPEEVTDYEIRDALKELTDSKTTENMRKILDEKLELRFSLGVDKPTFLLDIADKEDLVKDIYLSFVIHRTSASISQFADGMEVLGLMTLMRRYTALRDLLVYNNRFEITPKRFKEACTFNFCENGSNRRPVEERLAKRFLEYVDEIYRKLCKL